MSESRTLFKESRRQKWLLVVAAPAEAKSVLQGVNADSGLSDRQWELLAIAPSLDLVISGIGKSNAAGATARFLDLSRHSAVLSLGIGGALPGSGLKNGDVVAATASVYADEGIQTCESFKACSEMGFPLGPFEGSSIKADPFVLSVLSQLADTQGAVATVSTCSGLDSLAAEVFQRTGALVECMEGAAVAHIAARLGVASGELRVISNSTGDRPNQNWDLAGALKVLEAKVRELAASRSQP